ncbi:MAG: conserved phage C-terminal domain-containing protein [Magnetococcales bacterium]|nr:conserved phage C-terminal domain-containing protein [Magnetococcales bacterium]
MSIKAMEWAWQQPVKSGLKLVLLALADYANAQDACWPAIETLAHKCGMGRTTVLRHLEQLEESGCLRRHPRWSAPGMRGTDFYVLQIGSKLAESAPNLAKSAPNPLQIGTLNLYEPSVEPSMNPSGTTAGADVVHLRQTAQEIVQFLSQRVKRDFPIQTPTGAPTTHVELVMARLREGYSAHQCRMMIVRKIRDWGEQEKMRRFLRPITLFNKEKFETYLAECVVE